MATKVSKINQFFNVKFKFKNINKLAYNARSPHHITLQHTSKNEYIKNGFKICIKLYILEMCFIRKNVEFSKFINCARHGK